MRELFRWEQDYMQHLQEMKHRFFNEWQASGYRSEKAWSEFLRFYNKAAEYGRKLRCVSSQ